MPQPPDRPRPLPAPRPLAAVPPPSGARRAPSRRPAPQQNWLQATIDRLTRPSGPEPGQAGGRSQPRRPAPQGRSVPKPPAAANSKAMPPIANRRKGDPLWLQAVRTLIVGAGLGAIVGTVLMAFDPSMRQTASPAGTQINLAVRQSQKQLASTALPPPGSAFRQPIGPLRNQFQLIAARYPGLTLHAAALDLDTGDFAAWNDTRSVAAASTIKVPMLVAFFQDVDAGKIRLDEMLTMEARFVAPESGTMQYQKPGQKFSAIDTARQMIVISDNTATNMIMARSGGSGPLNQRFKSWGLQGTSIQDLLPDIAGLNRTTARDLVQLAALIHRGELVSMRSRDRLLAIMRGTVSTGLLPKGIGKGGDIAHKTGTLAKLLGDMGLVDVPNGRRYGIAVLAERAPNDPKAVEAIREYSRATYAYFNNLPPIAR